MAADFLKSHGIDVQNEMSTIQFSSGSLAQDVGNTESGEVRFSRQKVNQILNVKLPGGDADKTWDITIEDDTIASIDPHRPESLISSLDPSILDGHNAFLCPSLCHPHIHLDKCFLLSDPKYADLPIQKGDFAEALSLTSEAKSRFSPDDLLRRGRWLVEESIAAGVTCMRAFVEVDATVRFKCLDAGMTLKTQYRDACEIQICAFAQNPLFSSDSAVEGRRLMEEAVERKGVDVVGSTPYVEADEDQMRENVDWIIDTAMRYGKHLDLHLDYHLDASKEPMVSYVIEALHKRDWTHKARNKQIVLGHCTRLTLFTTKQWSDLRHRIQDLPISLVGLPNSDLFMMGKPAKGEEGGQRVRGTLQIPQMIQTHHMKGTVGVNNVGNAFTPQGNCDPLTLASMCVGVYQAGTKRDAEVLYECVSTRAKAAIGCGEQFALQTEVGDRADAVLIQVNGKMGGRRRRTLQEIIYDPPKERTVLYRGHLVRQEI
ncbi:MAG: hypothetical protein Q9182_001192 [Xanthomendoza sp. 2 TL-2023]